MLHRVIISHHQASHLRHFPACPLTVVVLDDPTAADVRVCSELGYTPVCVGYFGNRGANRNAGLNAILAQGNLSGEDIVEFLDGDRYPSKGYATERVESLLADNALDCLLYACGGKDARLSRMYVPLEGASLVDTGTLCNPFYSCGFAMRVSSIRRVMEFNNGYFFEPRFTKWGCEDQYMGLVCSHLGYRVGITCEISLNGDVGGDSDRHADYRESLQTYVDLIREHNFQIRNDPLF